jgi:hypothetical protein
MPQCIRRPTASAAGLQIGDLARVWRVRQGLLAGPDEIVHLLGGPILDHGFAQQFERTRAIEAAHHHQQIVQQRLHAIPG